MALFVRFILLTKMRSKKLTHETCGKLDSLENSVLRGFSNHIIQTCPCNVDPSDFFSLFGKGP